jgi:hypothetical protein
MVAPPFWLLFSTLYALRECHVKRIDGARQWPEFGRGAGGKHGSGKMMSGRVGGFEGISKF